MQLLVLATGYDTVLFQLVLKMGGIHASQSNLSKPDRECWHPTVRMKANSQSTQHKQEESKNRSGSQGQARSRTRATLYQPLSLPGGSITEKLGRKKGNVCRERHC